MFGYNTSVICDNNNYVLTVDTNGSNMHDSVSFYQSFENLINHLDIIKITYFIGNVAYLTSHICKILIDLGMIPAFPYTRLGYRKDYFNLYMMNIIIFIYAQNILKEFLPMGKWSMD